MANTPEQAGRKITQAFEDFLKSIPGFMGNMGEIIIKDRKENFMKGEGPDGEKWPRLKLKTVKQKKREHKTTKVRRRNKISGLGTVDAKPAKYPLKPLIDTGNLMNATKAVSGYSVKIKLARSRSEPVSGSFESVAAIHQKGAGNNPKRVHWGIPKQSMRSIERAWKILFRDKFLRKMR